MEVHQNIIYLDLIVDPMFIYLARVNRGDK